MTKAQDLLNTAAKEHSLDRLLNEVPELDEAQLRALIEHLRELRLEWEPRQ